MLKREIWGFVAKRKSDLWFKVVFIESPIFLATYGFHTEKTTHLFILSTNRSNYWYLRKIGSTTSLGRVPCIGKSINPMEQYVAGSLKHSISKFQNMSWCDLALLLWFYRAFAQIVTDFSLMHGSNHQLSSMACAGDGFIRLKQLNPNWSHHIHSVNFES